MFLYLESLMKLPEDGINEIIRIDTPQGTNVYFPLCVTLDANNCFTACGGTDDGNVSKFLKVDGQIVGCSSASPNYPGVPNGLCWTIPGIGPLQPGQVCQLQVTATVERAGGNMTSQCSKYFITVNNSYSCPSGHAPAAVSMFAGVMPRYYRVGVAEDVSGGASAVRSLTFGGGPNLSSVYLAYDSDSSTLKVPVWRDINLPDSLGKWTFRVTQTCCALIAELVQQTFLPSEVVTFTFRCSAWSFSSRRNLFTFVPSASSSGRAAPRHVVVEPA
jgi:hypothetical protein